MEITRKKIIIFSLLSFLAVLGMDFINVTQLLDYSAHLDSTIANTITFISILIGFISSIFVMIQQSENSYVLDLLRKFDLLAVFNRSFKVLMYIGFIDVFILIFMNFVASNIIIFKIVIYFAVPITTYFLVSSANIIITICKMISAEEDLRKLDKEISDEDIKF